MNISYRIESEIEKAFPYLDTLNKELKKLTGPKPKVAIKRKYIKSCKYFKDGYLFSIHFNAVYDPSNMEEVLYYEFFTDIKCDDERKSKELYQKFDDKTEADKYFKSMKNVFKILTRRDIIEKVFDFKIKQIEELKQKQKEQ